MRDKQTHNRPPAHTTENDKTGATRPEGKPPVRVGFVFSFSLFLTTPPAKPSTLRPARVSYITEPHAKTPDPPSNPRRTPRRAPPRAATRPRPLLALHRPLSRRAHRRRLRRSIPAHRFLHRREQRRRLENHRRWPHLATHLRLSAHRLPFIPELLWAQGRLQARFYIDPRSGLPHIHNHGVAEDEVIEILEKPGEDRPASEGARMALGQTASGRYLRVVYVPDPAPDSVFVITAFELSGKPLAAYRRRRRKKQQ